MNQAPEVTLGHELLAFYLHLLNSKLPDEKFNLLVNFLGVSVPFCANRYKHNMEFAVSKQSMGRANDKFFEKQIKKVFKRWQTRWLVVGYNNIFYYQYPEDPPHAIRDSIPFDNSMSMDILKISSSYVTCMITISRRRLKLSIDGTMNGLICMSYIVRAFRLSAYTAPHRFTSFAPIREGNDCIFFSDGVGYYKELYEAWNNAKSEIMITDWWLSPEFPLIRPIKGSLEDEESRVDFTLKRAAERGVRVYILLYKEFSLGLNTDSEHAKQRLESMHKNIKVIRHPNVVISLWSHHEKMCIVDKQKVFTGGLDLCWNRMDGNNHPLFNNGNLSMFPGVDYGNPLCKDIVKGREYKVSMIQNRDPRMPWHDVACMLVGKICDDFVMHFSAYWNHAKETNYEREVLAPKKSKESKAAEPYHYPPQAVTDSDPLHTNAFGEPMEDLQLDPYMAQGNPFEVFGGAQYPGQGSLRTMSANPTDQFIRQAYDNQKALTDQYSNHENPMTRNLALVYNRNNSQGGRPNRNPLMSSFMNPQGNQGINQQFGPGGNLPFEYGNNVQHQGVPGHHGHHHMQLHLNHNGAHSGMGMHNLHSQMNIFELLSGHHSPEEGEALLFRANSMEGDAERPKWRAWLSQNHQKLNAVSAMKHGDAETLKKYMEGINLVSNNPTAMEKMNRYLLDIDEKSRLLYNVRPQANQNSIHWSFAAAPELRGVQGSSAKWRHVSPGQ